MVQRTDQLMDEMMGNSMVFHLVYATAKMRASLSAIHSVYPTAEKKASLSAISKESHSVLSSLAQLAKGW